MAEPSPPRRYRPATTAVHAGIDRTRHGEMSEPIFLTQGFAYDSAEQAQARFDGEDPGYIYSRYGNPTVRVLERRMAEFEGAEDAVQAFVEGTGADGDDLNVEDGSGLSRKDLVTPDALAAVLRAMRGHPAAGSFRRSLPEGGGAGSTLRNRLSGVPVRAKTGSLLAVRCLAGYVDGPDGTPYVFVLMANNYTTSGGRIAGAQDDIVRALATGRRVPADE